MKKQLTISFGMLACVISLVTACSTSTDKLEEARENAVEANEELIDANAIYLSEVEKYRAETALRIAQNEKNAAEIKLKIANKKAAAREAYYKEIEALELQNENLKKRLSDYRADNKEKWLEFKAEFNGDMDRIGNALKDLAKDNSK